MPARRLFPPGWRLTELPVLLGLVTQSLLSGITNGLIYALVGFGIAAIFRGSHIANVMQGEFSVVGAVVVDVLLAELGWPYWAAAIAGCVSGVMLGAMIDVVFIRRLVQRNAPDDSYLLFTIGVSITISATVLFLFGRESHLLPPLGTGQVFIVLDAVLQEHAAWLIAISLLLMGGLRFFYRRTSLGMKMTAASIDPDGAATIGIDVQKMRTLTFVVGGLLGATAGILISPIIPVGYLVGLPLTLKGFSAAILGGLTNPLGAVAGGLTIGVIEALVIMEMSSAYKDVVTFSVLILIMIMMPNGILGRAGRAGG
jgi:branched-chain amino acid transport system permease protein